MTFNKSTAYAVTDNGVIIAKGSKRAMLRKRADLAAKDCSTDKGLINVDSRYHVYLAMSQPIGTDMTK